MHTSKQDLTLFAVCAVVLLQSALAALMAAKPGMNLTLPTLQMPSLPQVDLSGLVAMLDKNVSLSAPQVRLLVLLLQIVAGFGLWKLHYLPVLLLQPKHKCSQSVSTILEQSLTHGFYMFCCLCAPAVAAAAAHPAAAQHAAAHSAQRGSEPRCHPGPAQPRWPEASAQRHPASEWHATVEDGCACCEQQLACA
jgi:hypothetical protein